MRAFVPVERALHGGAPRVSLLDAFLQRLLLPLDIRASTAFHLELVFALLLQPSHRVLRLGHPLRHLPALSLAPDAQGFLRGYELTLALLHLRHRGG